MIIILFLLALFFFIKAILSEKGVISDECNECMNDIVTSSFSNDDFDE